MLNIKLAKKDEYNFGYVLTKKVLSYVNMDNILETSMYFDPEKAQYVVCFTMKLNFVKQKGIFDVFIRFSYKDMQDYISGRMYTDVLFKEHLIKGFALKRA